MGAGGGSTADVGAVVASGMMTVSGSGGLPAAAGGKASGSGPPHVTQKRFSGSARAPQFGHTRMPGGPGSGEVGVGCAGVSRAPQDEQNDCPGGESAPQLPQMEAAPAGADDPGSMNSLMAVKCESH
jgi:hypothetical protein